MKKFKILFLFLLLFVITGCFNNDSMDNIEISTSIYPVKYVTEVLYGEHSNVVSIYPLDANTEEFEVTNVLLDHLKKMNM